MSSAGGNDVIFNLSADAAGVLAAFDEIMAGVDAVAASGSSLSELDVAFSEIPGALDGVAGDLAATAQSMWVEIADVWTSGQEDVLASTADFATSVEAEFMDLEDVLVGHSIVPDMIAKIVAAFGSLAGSTLGGLSSWTSSVIDMFTHMGAMLIEFEAIGGLINAISGFVGSMFGMNEQFQRLNVTLTQMVGSNRAQQLTDWIKQFGTEVPFTTEAVEQATVALTAYGQNAETVLPAVAAAAAAMSARGITLDTATRAYIDALNGRFVMMQNQLGISQEMLKQFGYDTTNAATKAATLGTAFEKAVNAKYPGMLAAQMGTFGGMLAEANDLVQLFAMHLGAPLFAAAQEGLGMVMQYVTDHKADLDHIAEVAGGILADGFRFFGDVIQGVGVLLRTLVIPMFQALSDLLKPLAGPLGNLAGAFGNLAAAVGGGLIGALQGIAGGFKDMTGAGGPLAPIVRGIASAIQWAADGVNNLVDGVSKGTGPFASLKGYLQPVGDFLQTIGDAIGSVQWSDIVNFFASIGNYLSPLVPMFAALGPLIANFAGGFIDMISRFTQGSMGNPAVFWQIWNGAISMVLPALQNLGNVIMTQLVPAFQHLFEALTPIMPLVGEFVGLLLTIDLTLITQELAAVITGIINFVAGCIQAFSGLLNFFAGFFSLLVDAFHGNWDKVMTDSQQMTAAIGQIIAGIWNATAGNVLGIIGNLAISIETIFQNLFETLVGHSIIPDMVNAIGEWFGKLPGMLGNALGQMVPIAIEFGAKTLEGFIGGLLSQLPHLVGTMGTIAADVSGPLISLGGQAFGWGFNVLANFVTGLTSGAAAKFAIALGQWYNDVVAGFNLVVSTAWTKAIDTVGQFVSGLLTGAGKVASTVLGWADQFHQKVNQIINSAFTSGRQIVQMLINGMLSMLGNLANAAAQVAQTIANHLPRSPAKEGPLSTIDQSMPAMIAILKQGILDGRPEIANAMSLLAGQMKFGVPSVGGLPLGTPAAGINAASVGGALQSSRAEELLARLVAIAEGQSNRSQALGPAPTNAQLGSIVQNNTFNAADALSFYNALDLIAGLKVEYAQRGAING